MTEDQKRLVGEIRERATSWRTTEQQKSERYCRDLHELLLIIDDLTSPRPDEVAVIRDIRIRYDDLAAKRQSPGYVKDVGVLLRALDEERRKVASMQRIAAEADHPSHEILLHRIASLLADGGIIPLDADGHARGANAMSPEQEVEQIAMLQDMGIKVPLGSDVLPPLDVLLDTPRSEGRGRVELLRLLHADWSGLEFARMLQRMDAQHRGLGKATFEGLLRDGLVTRNGANVSLTAKGRLEAARGGPLGVPEYMPVAGTRVGQLVPPPSELTEEWVKRKSKKSRTLPRQQLRCEALVPAETLDQGEFFRKRTGTTPYLRLSPSAVRHYKLDESKVYGVTLYGNMTIVSPDVIVAKVCAEHALGSEMDRTLPEDPDGPEDFADEPQAIQRRIGIDLAAIYEAALEVSPVVTRNDLLAAWNEVVACYERDMPLTTALRQLTAVSLRACIEEDT